MASEITLSAVVDRCTELTALQVAAGYLTWMGVAKTFAVILGGVCLTYLFGRFVMDVLRLFARVPFMIYEVIGFVGSAALLAAPTLLGVSGPDVTWFIVPGGILFAGTLILSATLRNLSPNNARFFGLLAVIYGAAAVWYANPVAGFGAVVTFMAFTGFSIIVMPLSYAIGFDDEKATNRAGGAGLLICLILVFERAMAAPLPALDVFRTGMEWMGPFVFGLAVLINSTRWIIDSKRQSYVAMQVVAVLSYAAMIWVGGTYRIDALLNVGTGMLILWMLEKPFEVHYRSLTTLAGVGLAVSLAVGGAVYWAQHNLDIVAKWMPAFVG